eukprot:1194531-Prorocentrum_minimum.AAC.10
MARSCTPSPASWRRTRMGRCRGRRGPGSSSTTAATRVKARGRGGTSCPSRLRSAWWVPATFGGQMYIKNGAR